MTDPAAQADIATLTFEEALKELETIVQQLEAGRGTLDEAISSYERGAALKRHCEAKLGEAEAKVERIRKQADGTIETEPAQID